MPDKKIVWRRKGNRTSEGGHCASHNMNCNIINVNRYRFIGWLYRQIQRDRNDFCPYSSQLLCPSHRWNFVFVTIFDNATLTHQQTRSGKGRRDNVRNSLQLIQCARNGCLSTATDIYTAHCSNDSFLCACYLSVCVCVSTI